MSKQQLKLELKKAIKNCLSRPKTRRKFERRCEQGSLTRDENPESHFCAFFAGYDPQKKEVFIGHHMKGDRWLFNGGHIDQGELMKQAVKREMSEEWGSKIGSYQLTGPSLLTITYIDNPNISCKTHFDIWFFVELDKSQFEYDKKLLKAEFHDWGWFDLEEARDKIESNDEVMEQALDFIESKFF